MPTPSWFSRSSSEIPMLTHFAHHKTGTAWFSRVFQLFALRAQKKFVAGGIEACDGPVDICQVSASARGCCWSVFFSQSEAQPILVSVCMNNELAEERALECFSTGEQRRARRPGAHPVFSPWKPESAHVRAGPTGCCRERVLLSQGLSGILASHAPHGVQRPKPSTGTSTGTALRGRSQAPGTVCLDMKSNRVLTELSPDEQ